jgi:hypothetical protein
MLMPLFYSGMEQNMCASFPILTSPLQTSNIILDLVRSNRRWYMDAAMRLPRFQEALKGHSKSLSTGTYWRYMNGLLPAFGELLVERPELAQALAADAVELAATKGDEGAMKGGNEATINQVV